MFTLAIHYGLKSCYHLTRLVFDSAYYLYYGIKRETIEEKILHEIEEIKQREAILQEKLNKLLESIDKDDQIPSPNI